MPTTRKRLTRGRRLPALSLAMVDLLLGVCRSPDEIAQLLAAGHEYDPWLEFDNIPQATLNALVDAHRPTLTREARRLGIAVPWARTPASQGDKAMTRYENKDLATGQEDERGF